MKKALITGITGQDGTFLSKLLFDKGYKVYGIIKENEPAADLANLDFVGVRDNVELIPANLLDLAGVTRILEETNPDEIYNLAAQSSVSASFAKPILTVEFNTLSTLNLLEAMRTLSSKAKFYQASSSEMFGKVKDLPVTEKTVLHPLSPYAISKASCHWLAVNYREAFGLSTACGILFNHESVLRPPFFVTKKIISTAVRIKQGSQEKLELGNTSIQRDWGYAPYYVEAMWLMLQQEKTDDYILATKEAHSLKEFVEKVFECLDLDWEKYVRINKSFFRPSDIEIIYGDPSKVKEQLGWKYDLCFEDLVKKLVNDELKHGERVAAGRGAK